MHMRAVFLSVLVLAACLITASVAQAASKEIHIRRDAAVNVDDQVYKTMQDLYDAIIAGTASLDQGTEVILHNDDNSLENFLSIPSSNEILFRSATGKRYVVSNRDGTWQSYILHSSGINQDLRVENLDIDGNAGTLINLTNNSTAFSSLTVSNSKLTSTGEGINLNGRFNLNLTNTAIDAAGVYAINFGTGNLNITFDKKADDMTYWNGSISHSGSVTVDVASGKKWYLNGNLTASTVTKNGGGVWRLVGGSASSLTVNNGTLYLAGTGGKGYNLAGDLVVGGNWHGNSMHIGSKGVLKVYYDPGNLKEWFQAGAPEDMMVVTSKGTMINLDGGVFTSEEGARTEIGLISKHPVVPIKQNGSATRWTYARDMIYVGKDTWSDGTEHGRTQYSTIVDSMNINNKLLKATWKSTAFEADDIVSGENSTLTDKDGFMLHIEYVNNLALLNGIGSFADVYRMMDLSDPERDMLDTLYCTGGKYGFGFLQTVGGYHVQYSLLGMRHNQFNLLNKVNQRSTRYQREELEMNLTDSVCDYSDYNPLNEYGEMWAYADQTWTRQNDVGGQAGYRFQAHTIGIGYDWHNDNMIYGGAIQYAGGDIKLKNATDSRTDIDNIMMALYASWAQEGWYMSGTANAGYGWNDSKSSYTLSGFTGEAETGNYSTTMFGVSMETGYMWETEFMDVPMRITPYGGLGYTRFHRNGIRESGGDNGTVDMNRQFRAITWPVWEMALGVRLAAPIERCGYTLIPTVDLAWNRTMGKIDKDGSIHFINRGGGGWDVNLLSGNRSAYRLGTGLEARIGERLSVGGGYAVEYRSKSWSHQLNVNMALGF